MVECLMHMTYDSGANAAFLDIDGNVSDGSAARQTE
jgi:hypothetical protein